MSSRHSRTDAHINSDSVATCARPHRFEPGGFLVLRGELSQVPTPNYEAIFNWFPLIKERLVFSNGVSLGL